MGDRLGYLQHGLDAATAIGDIGVISSVVETPAVGFEGNPFLNACFTIDTQLPPAVVMQKLLDIEQSQGRLRSQGQGYQNRTLDLDMIFYDDLVLDIPNLIMPHPAMAQRRFVLQPLCEIAPHKQHPVYQKSTQALLDTCEDNTPLSIHELKLRHPIYAKLSAHTFICVEGIIGCGKTTLTKRLAQHLGFKTIEERFAENPFLPKFYRDPKRYAFPLELSFLADRFNQINEESEQLDLFQSGVVADYHMSKSLVFAQNTLNEDEYPLFHQLYQLMSKSANQPSLCIYLRQTPYTRTAIIISGLVLMVMGFLVTRQLKTPLRGMEKTVKSGICLSIPLHKPMTDISGWVQTMVLLDTTKPTKAFAFLNLQTVF